jgi:hypothetical protein
MIKENNNGETKRILGERLEEIHFVKDYKGFKGLRFYDMYDNISHDLKITISLFKQDYYRKRPVKKLLKDIRGVFPAYFDDIPIFEEKMIDLYNCLEQIEYFLNCHQKRIYDITVNLLKLRDILHEFDVLIVEILDGLHEDK